ncbi:hypothetical protein ACFX12_036596 [Malus domestica]
MFETISRNPTIDPYDTSGILLEYVKGDVELKDVYFRYPARPAVPIFGGFSLYVPSGTTTALVGESGSGKSTVIGLVERFYDPEAGEVLIDGVDLKKFQLKAIREKIGLVSQEPNLFTTTIRENISYGKDDATDEEIRRATELANAAKFIDKLPQGIDTMVGEHGTSLSGGQKQRIAIARAILKNPRILLLDEATSALDAESEKIVQDALVNLMSNCTTIVVAHRLTTIRNADCIAVVHRGKIVEKGTHDELTKDPEGAYSQLIRLQEGSKVDNKTQTSDPNRVDTSLDIDRTMLSCGNQILSMRRSISRGSPGSRHSFTIGFGIPGPIDIQESEVEHEGDHDRPKVDPKERKTVSIRRLAALYKPELPVLLLGSIAAAGHGVIFLIFGLLLTKAIRIFYEPPNELRQDCRKWALVYVGLACTGLLKVVHQQVSWFDDPENSSGAIGARLSTDASVIKSLVGDALALIVQNIATIMAGFIIGFTANWKLALIVLAISPVMILQGTLQAKFLKGFSADAKVMEAYEKKCEGTVRSTILVKHGQATFEQVFMVFFAVTMSAMGVSQSTSWLLTSTKPRTQQLRYFKFSTASLRLTRAAMKA